MAATVSICPFLLGINEAAALHSGAISKVKTAPERAKLFAELASKRQILRLGIDPKAADVKAKAMEAWGKLSVPQQQFLTNHMAKVVGYFEPAVKAA